MSAQRPSASVASIAAILDAAGVATAPAEDEDDPLACGGGCAFLRSVNAPGIWRPEGAAWGPAESFVILLVRCQGTPQLLDAGALGCGFGGPGMAFTGTPSGYRRTPSLPTSHAPAPDEPAAREAGDAGVATADAGPGDAAGGWLGAETGMYGERPTGAAFPLVAG